MVSVMQALNEQQRDLKSADNFRMPNPSVMKKLIYEREKMDTLDNRRGSSIESLITIGNKPSTADSQSGSIMKALAAGIDGFHSRIAQGVKNGHTYNVIHIPGHMNFWFEDQWVNDKGKLETRRDPFVITQEIKIIERPIESDHGEWMGVMDDMNQQADEIINSVKNK